MSVKLYCYVDETGQDTRGVFFMVGVVVADQDRDAIRNLCLAFERLSGKGRAKWLKAGFRQKRDYIGRVLYEPSFNGRLFVAVYQRTQEFRCNH
jgi:hypothetical protein